MYAILKSGGKQYKVQAGDVIRVEKMQKDLGSEFELTEVLAIGGDKTFIGEPKVANAKVTVVVTNQEKAPKVIVFKKKRRQGYRRMQGHRQLYTELFIKAITSPEGDVSKTEDKPCVFDPEKKEARLAEKAEGKKLAKKPGAKKAAGKKKTAKKKTAKKKVVKKKAAKKKTAKKATAKKKTAKKKIAKKATTKKKTKKKS